MDVTSLSRRKFIRGSAMAAAYLPFVSPSINATAKKSMDEMHISIFSKHLQFLDYQEMADVAAKIGFNGIDLTVSRQHAGKPSPKR